VDSITHALLVAALLTAVGSQEFVLFGILGAVILDADILFTFISRNRPSLYLYIHGGAAHSILGSTIMAVCAYIVFFLLSIIVTGTMHYPAIFTFGILALVCTVCGAWSHIALDYLATPGIPLFWPLSEKKYTAGIFAGPSFFMIIVSWIFIVLLVAGIIPLTYLPVYGIIFLVFLCIRSMIRIIAFVRVSGDTYPTFNPLRWMVIRKEGGSWSTGLFSLNGGTVGEVKYYPENTGITTDELRKIETLPEVRRVRYHSYFTVAERNGDTVTIKDPSRENGTIRYPPYYKKVSIAADGRIIND